MSEPLSASPMPVEVLIRWLETKFKLPPDTEYNRGWNDAILDMRNVLTKKSDHDKK